ncbi:MAG: hypothetical protein ILO34_02470 [Kiritimatiellae bacterium]|nr:hypothetical protein [Kiritimatiellia bacterium]
MIANCRFCGKEIDVADAKKGQHVLCPYCNGKFSFNGRAAAKREITSEDLASALAECRRNPDLDELYASAPTGARLFILLLFYGRAFRGSFDVSMYMDAFAEIETELDEEDLKYLLERENDPQIAGYLRGLMANARRASSRPLQGILRDAPPERRERIRGQIAHKVRALLDAADARAEAEDDETADGDAFLEMARAAAEERERLQFAKDTRGRLRRERVLGFAKTMLAAVAAVAALFFLCIALSMLWTRFARSPAPAADSPRESQIQTGRTQNAVRRMRSVFANFPFHPRKLPEI